MKDDMPDLGERQIRELVIIAVTCLKPERIQVRNLVETCVLISTAAYVFIKDQYKKKNPLTPFCYSKILPSYATTFSIF